MNFRSINRLAQLFGVAVVDQIVLSGANFFVGFLLIRETSDTDYGLYILITSALALFVSAQTSWLSGPLAVVVFKKTPERRREMVGAVRASQTRFLRVIAVMALVIPPVLYLLQLRTALLATVLAVAILASWAGLQREYLRAVLLLYQRPHQLLRADLFYVGVLLSGAVLAAFGPGPAVLTIAATLAIAAWLGGRIAYRQLDADPGWVTADAAPVWREIRALGTWSVIGAVIYWVYTQSYVYVLASRLDLSAVANINAARLLLQPIIVLTVGIYGLLTPSAAAWLADFGFRRLMRRLLAFIVVVAIIDLGYFALVWYFRDGLSTGLLHRNIADRDRLLLLWGAVALIGLLRDILQCALLALGRQRSLAGLVAVSATVSLAIMWFGLDRWGPAAALIGQITGELVNLAGLIGLLWEYFQLDSKR
jgi:O-antigen/teichoic acid export membrane protein